jgi:hypothetical protein
MIISGVGVGAGVGVSVGQAVLLGSRVGRAVGGGAVRVGVGATSANWVAASSPERVPRAITSALLSPIQRISFGKVSAVWILPCWSVTAAA